ncbi:putative cell cycle control protein tyrosine phosphatase Mih1 [Xylona heveae TC161]|uniref:M-phase inducer phosphatase n=1 Tax=Xylona heveae (strain CBS 132557 / TC161) TaxID=1328760 RepID=A0A165GPC1_XYLHT|nr:putative cell cycle control protein tyrosine phosphatase Mih1 [Xylona heveae TC161]KZF22431.1 putative cell cycle control protein tyrosine phosphatase Mih1 [Xylona heveae TC161]
MEHSSPLAAMQPPPLPLGSWGYMSNVPTSHSRLAGNAMFGPGSFNFKDLSMKRSSSDYFSMKPVRGSSPTASLAADLSQNFHIDQSPQLPTPRRSLFTSNFFGTLDGRETMTTPPIPSSSPGPGNDIMDISPLPHKPAFAVTQIELRSPTPETSPAGTPMAVSPICSGLSPLDSSQHNTNAESKRSQPRRPMLPRTKGFSTNSVSFKTTGLESHLPQFKFGAGAATLSPPLTLDQCFTDSPSQEGKTSSNASLMPPPRPRQAFAAMAASARSNGSPITGHIRKSSGSAIRPRKQFRRSLSMFEHPGDVMSQEQEEMCSSSTLQSIMDIEDNFKPQLPHFLPDHPPDSLPRITLDTLIDVLDGKYDGLYEDSLVVDCRFEYEYEGGHINGAINYNDKELLATRLFDQAKASKTLLIFHCEYSAHRAPMMAKFVRQQDRAVNAACYPKLTYPEVYILDGGYSSFFNAHRSRCFPQNYVEMDSKEHELACERGMGKLRQRAKLGRAQTYAFGQSFHDESPTAPSKSSNDSMMGNFTSQDRVTDLRRMHARRMASC